MLFGCLDEVRTLFKLGTREHSQQRVFRKSRPQGRGQIGQRNTVRFRLKCLSNTIQTNTMYFGAAAAAAGRWPLSAAKEFSRSAEGLLHGSQRHSAFAR